VTKTHQKNPIFNSIKLKKVGDDSGDLSKISL